MPVPLPFELEQRKEGIRSEIEKMGAEMLGIEIRRYAGRNVISVTADKVGGITLEDCVNINRRLSDYFDELSAAGSSDVLSQSYTLEVVSPGLDRPLRGKSDFQRASGQWVKVHYLSAGRPAALVGKVDSVDDDAVTLRPADGSDARRFHFNEITRAVREIRFKRD